LALASQRIETEIFDFDVKDPKDLEQSKEATKRGAPPTLIELMVLPWVLGMHFLSFLLTTSDTNCSLAVL
jgi:hypothetical protein